MVQLQWMPRGTPQKAIKVKAAKVCALVLPIFMHLTLRRFRARRNLRRRLDRLAALVARDANKDRDRAAAIQEIDGLPDYIFRRMFRMTRPTFNALLKKINEHYPESSSEDFIKKNVKDNNGQVLSNKTKLLATLRFLAGGQMWDICLALKIGFGSFYQSTKYGVIWPMMEAIDALYEIGMPLDDEQSLQNIAQDFAKINESTREIFAGVVLAIDGLVIQTRKPTKLEVGDRNVTLFRNRKGIWGIVILAGCDASKRYRFWNATSSGSTNDCIAWAHSALKAAVDAGRLPRGYYFIGDEAFSCTPQFLSPWSGRGLPKCKDSFNYYLSCRRQVIECSFGILVHRWGILQRALTCAFERWALVTTVCAKLHNICIDERVPLASRFEKDVSPRDSANVFDNIHHDDLEGPIRAYGDDGAKRHLLTEMLDVQGINRPQYAMCNSRA